MQDCGEPNDEIICRGKPCGLSMICGDVSAGGIAGEREEQKTFSTVGDVLKHWKSDCRAFVLVCPDCLTPTKMREHKCVKELKREKAARKIAIECYAEDLRMKKEDLDAVAGNFQLADDEHGRLIQKFENWVFVKLVKEDR